MQSVVRPSSVSSSVLHFFPAYKVAKKYLQNILQKLEILFKDPFVIIAAHYWKHLFTRRKIFFIQLATGRMFKGMVSVAVMVTLIFKFASKLDQLQLCRLHNKSRLNWKTIGWELIFGIAAPFHHGPIKSRALTKGQNSVAVIESSQHSIEICLKRRTK